MLSRNNNVKVIKEYFATNKVRRLFQQNDLSGFTDLWDLDASRVEPPNERRKGISGVVTFELKVGDGSVQRIFIKRQENHNTRTLKHPLRGVPTFFREFNYVQKLQHEGVPVIEVLYYGQALLRGNQQAILVSRALEGYVSLEKWFAHYEERNDPIRVRSVLQAVVNAIKSMHQKRVRHGSLHGKHVLVRPPANGYTVGSVVDVCLIDLEKARRPMFHNRMIEKDLSQLLRYTKGITREEFHTLVDLYFDESDQKRWHLRLQRAIETKLRKHANSSNVIQAND
jgi:hypothetical protein